MAPTRRWSTLRYLSLYALTFGGVSLAFALTDHNDDRVSMSIAFIVVGLILGAVQMGRRRRSQRRH